MKDKGSHLCDRCGDRDCTVRGMGRISSCAQFRPIEGVTPKSKPQRSKYNNQKTVAGGMLFDSKKEANRYMELKVMEAEGLIKDLVIQPEIELQESCTRNDKVILPITYRADFKYTDVATSKTVIEDVKGMKTQVYRLKKKMMLYQGYEVREI